MNWFWQLIGRLLGLENLQSFERLEFSLAAPWAQSPAAPGWIFMGCAALVAGSFYFYYRFQNRGSRKARLALAGMRAAILVIVLLSLFEPTLVAHYTSNPRPQLWVLFDGTDSMNIKDEYPDSERAKLAEATALNTAGKSDKPSRADYLRSLLEKSSKDNLLAKLDEKFRLRTFVFDRPDGVRALELSTKSDRTVDPKHVAQQYKAEGQVTAIGAALSDLGRRHSTGQLAGVVVFSDFDQNAGPPPLAAAQKLGAPVYPVGVGPIAALDLAVDLQAPLVMKKAERSMITVLLRQSGLEGKTVDVKLTAKKLDESASPVVIEIGDKSQTLSADVNPVEFPFTPDDTGRFELIAEVAKAEGEAVTQNNRATRETNIRDDFLRLMFVEYEPTWEWRFIKEVFHRDKLVGMRGFRTFLRSSDPKVRQSNELFLPTLTPKRSDFFSNDVIFLGDMPGSTLSTRFCEMTKEFVSTFGGGLVIVAGPRFGPGELAQTPLADMLPVVVDPDSRVRDAPERDGMPGPGFAVERTLESAQFDFMQLGQGDGDNDKGWKNLSHVPWYQPVARPHPLATVLMDVPAHKCVDGVTPQPLVAIRRYGRGEVIYIGFNETWRLRKKYGELYYRQFWGQMIHRLGLSHALGTQKRFVVRTDRQQYQTDDQALVTVEAYDANFEPLTEDKLNDRKLAAELFVPESDSSGGMATQALSVPQLRDGVYETRVPLFKKGEHKVRVIDPVTSEPVEVSFQVTSRSAEGRSAVRNVSLEKQLAQTTGGKNYDLETVAKLPEEVNLNAKTETLIEVFPLWNTWLCFTALIVLMLGEWLIRKVIHLP